MRKFRIFTMCAISSLTIGVVSCKDKAQAQDESSAEMVDSTLVEAEAETQQVEVEA